MEQGGQDKGARQRCVRERSMFLLHAMLARIFGETMQPCILHERLREFLRVQSVKKGKTHRRHAVPNEASGDLGGLRDFATGNVEAVLKSAEILARGLRALNFNMHGATNMTVDDGVSAARALMDCATVPQWIELQPELVKLNAGRATIRALLLSVMTMQAAEEALFPLIVRANAAHRVFARTLGA